MTKQRTGLIGFGEIARERHAPSIGCGAMIPLSLNPKRRLRWLVAADWLRRPSLTREAERC